jgi:thiol-disulfide isomerase/thioredoxin
MQILNYFSFLLLAGLILLVGGWVILQRTAGATRWLSLGALTLGLIAAFWFFNPGPGTAGAEDLLAGPNEDGRPILLEFESPYCLGCIAAQPLVDEITRRFAGELDVIQVNILAADSASLKDRFQVQFTPTFILLDAQGEEAWRSIGTVDPEQLQASLSGGS